jgi:hypothetical protein
MVRSIWREAFFFALEKFYDITWYFCENVIELYRRTLWRTMQDLRGIREEKFNLFYGHICKGAIPCAYIAIGDTKLYRMNISIMQEMDPSSVWIELQHIGNVPNCNISSLSQFNFHYFCNIMPQ